MTQKRGLGRGLGALIPGASSEPEPEQELRTRSTEDEPERTEEQASVRPADMFFTGERAGADEERAQREESPARDLAGGMAKAAAQRRGKNDSATRGRTANGSKSRTASSSASTRTSSGASTSAGTSSTRRTNGSTGSRQSTATGTSAPEPKAEAPAPAAATAPSEDSPAVDVEAVTSTPARRAEETGSDPTGTAAQEAAQAQAPAHEGAGPGDAVSTSADAGTPATGGEETPAASSSEAGGPSREGLVSVPGAEFAEIPIHEVRENPRNPRSVFDEDELDELAVSLRQVGVLQPVVVRPIPATDDGESFELVMGERRWRAARRAGLTSIPAIIRETSDNDLLRDALLENLHRTQLNPLEEAAAYQQLLDDFECTQDELGGRIGRSRPQITNTLRLLRLPPLVQRRLASGALSAGHARALLGIDDPAMMEELAQRTVSEGLSVRAVERLVAGGSQPAANRAPRRTTYDPHVVDLTSRLSNRLETQVRIDVGKRKGKITLEFTNLEDLERLVENIGLDSPDSAAAEED